MITEAMFLLHDAGGWRAQRLLWDLLRRRDLEVVDVTPLVDRVIALMEKYDDQPMSLADATLVSLAEARSVRTVFTLDSDFTVYRFRGRDGFHVVP